jgi:lipopolysaccharide/colanic/teichoic acid biosynthesis glycosyltransferase
MATVIPNSPRSSSAVAEYPDQQFANQEYAAPIPLGSEFVHPLVRLLEIAVAIVALLGTFPIMALMALLIRLGTPGRALFFQERVGLNGKKFKFVKFRTLYADARKRFPELYAYRYSDEELLDLKFKVEEDPRVTPQGKWMRRSTLDELPNFWNVLKGDMALVGPRPEIPEMLSYYKGDMLLKFTVRPGVTGLAQVSGRGRLGFYETVDLDVQYVKEHSFYGDLKIILKTVQKIVIRDGAF